MSSSLRSRYGVDDGMEDVEELVLKVELRSVDAEVEARGEGRFDRLKAVDVGLAARNDDLEEFGDDGVDVAVERSERRYELRRRLSPKKSAKGAGQPRMLNRSSELANPTRTEIRPSR